jgi:ankyrin repeat protein
MSGEDLRLRAEMGDVEGLKLALSGGANPCSRDHMGLTALHYAVWNGHLNCVEVLCANHIGVDDVAIEARKQAEEEERIAKEKAEKKARKEAKKKAKEGGAGSATNTVVSPTSKFAQRKQHEAEEKALKDAADNAASEIELPEDRISCIDLQSSMGLTPLHLAAMEAPDGARIINMLLLCNARRDILDIEGCTALDRAKATGRTQCEDAIAECTVTKAEIDSFRQYMESELRVQSQKETFQANPRLKVRIKISKQLNELLLTIGVLNDILCAI